MKHRIAIAGVLALWLVARAALGQDIQLPEKADARTGKLNAIVVKSILKTSWLFVPEVEAFREHDPDAGTLRLRFIPPRDGQYVLVCAAVQGDRVVQVACVITATGTGEPKPTPVVVKPLPPVPKPVPQNGFGLEALTKAELAKVPAEARGLATNLAENFEWAAGKLSGITPMTIGQAQADLDARNSEVVAGPKNLIAWLPFFSAWKSHVEGLNNQGRLATAENWAAAYRETAAALRK